jgi:hypothetical protein
MLHAIAVTLALASAPDAVGESEQEPPRDWASVSLVTAFPFFEAGLLGPSVHVTPLENLIFDATLVGLPGPDGPTGRYLLWTAVARVGPRLRATNRATHGAAWAVWVAPVGGIRYLQGSFAHGNEAGIGLNAAALLGVQWWVSRSFGISVTGSAGWTHWATRGVSTPGLSIDVGGGVGIVLGGR